MEGRQAEPSRAYCNSVTITMILPVTFRGQRHRLGWDRLEIEYANEVEEIFFILGGR